MALFRAATTAGWAAAAAVLLVVASVIANRTRRLRRRSESSALTTNPSSEEPPNIIVVYATSSGTAELFAGSMAAEGRRKGLRIAAIDATLLEANPATTATNSATAGVAAVFPDSVQAVVFIVATYGEGEPTDSFRHVMAALKAASATVTTTRDGDGPSGDSASPHVSLRHLSFSVFALGDSSYKYFCKAGRDTDQLMAQLGAQRLHPVATGDARFDQEDAFDDWRGDVFALLATAVGDALREEGDAPQPPELRFAVVSDSAVLGPRPDVTRPFPQCASALPPTLKAPLLAPVAKIVELVRNPTGCDERDEKRTLHIELDCSSVAALKYEAGDHCGVLACNTDANVAEYLGVLDLQGVSPADVVELTSAVRAARRASRVNALPRRVTLATALKWYVSLAGVPKKSSLRIFAKYCRDTAERREFCALLGDAEQYRAALRAACPTVLHFLRRFPSCRVPVGHFLEAMPRIAPRYFSIASDQLAQPRAVHLTAALVDKGLCSTMFRGMADAWPRGHEQPAEPSAVFIFVRRSTFHLSAKQRGRPVIAIGPGSGIAPFVGFLHRRSAWLAKQSGASRGADLGECWLYFGCRHQNQDFLHRSQLLAWLPPLMAADTPPARVHALTKLETAFSRDGANKVYVQHLIERDAPALRDLILQQNAVVYICGDAAGMAAAVEQTLIDHVLCGVNEGSDLSDDAVRRRKTGAVATLLTMEQQGRYLKDVWTL
jgi:NADPH-ferrihemoprotein reductase